MTHRPAPAESGWLSQGDAFNQTSLDVVKCCGAWFDSQCNLDPAKLVFVDDRPADQERALARPCVLRRALLGRRAAGPIGKTTTFTRVSRLSDMTAPLVYDGAMNGNVFRAYVKQVLIPSLAYNDVVIMDNLLA